MPVQALVVGSFVMDLAFHVPRTPMPGEVIVATRFGVYRGGKGYNQAVALARLGAQVEFVGALGDDHWGDDFVSALEREGIGTSRVARIPGIHTSVATPLVTPDGDVGFVHAPGANRFVAVDHPELLPRCDLLFLQCEIPVVASLAAARMVRARGGTVVLTPAPVGVVTTEMLHLSHVICANEVEARSIAATVGNVPENPVVLAKVLAGDRIAVVTLGAKGAAFAGPGGWGRASPPVVDAVDATGAGDSFCAALGLELAEGLTLTDAVRFACAAGAHAATHYGAEPGLPRRADVERLVRSQESLEERLL